MGTWYKELFGYFNKTHKAQIKKDWEETKDEEQGVLISEFIKDINKRLNKNNNEQKGN